jgi:RND family efflux transporter MFP subunit
MTVHQRTHPDVNATFVLSSLLSAALLTGCSGGGPGGAESAGAEGPGGGAPAMPVAAVSVAAQPVEQTTEYIGTLKSRRSTTIQPQAEGFITGIAVRSGDRVSAGALLFEIDSGRQQAMVAQLESMRTLRAADLAYARQQADRARTLYAAGAMSQRDLEQAETSMRTSEAQVQAVEQQIQEQRVELGYYKVTAPTSGSVGDIPVRVGDRVTRSTVLTTVDQNEALEIYVNVPVQQAPDLRLGLPLRIVDDTGGTLATNRVTFISPTVDDATQTVLAKAQLIEGRGRFRADQFIRARIVWRSTPAITVPMTAVTRISGQHFVFVAEKQGEMLVAKQRPVALGDLIGNEYLLVSGLKAGEQLIVSGIQKIGDGAPVQVMPAAPAAPRS